MKKNQSKRPLSSLKKKEVIQTKIGAKKSKKVETVDKNDREIVKDSKNAFSETMKYILRNYVVDERLREELSKKIYMKDQFLNQESLEFLKTLSPFVIEALQCSLLLLQEANHPFKKVRNIKSKTVQSVQTLYLKELKCVLLESGLFDYEEYRCDYNVFPFTKNVRVVSFSSSDKNLVEKFIKSFNNVSYDKMKNRRFLHETGNHEKYYELDSNIKLTGTGLDDIKIELGLSKVNTVITSSEMELGKTTKVGIKRNNSSKRRYFGACLICGTKRKDSPKFSENKRKCNDCDGKKVVVAKFVIEMVFDIMPLLGKSWVSTSCKFIKKCDGDNYRI